MTAATLMACEQGMQQEAAYFEALEAASGYQILDGQTLRIDYDSGKGYPEQLLFYTETRLVDTL